MVGNLYDSFLSWRKKMGYPDQCTYEDSSISQRYRVFEGGYKLGFRKGLVAGGLVTLAAGVIVWSIALSSGLFSIDKSIENLEKKAQTPVVSIEKSR